MRIVFADDHALVREGLRRLLSTLPEVEVVGEAKDGVDLLHEVKARRPDLVLVDLSMPRLGGLQAIRMVREASPETRVIVLSMYGAEGSVHEALRAGARGYLLKGDPSEELIAAVRAVHAGRFYLSSSINAGVIESFIKSNAGGETRTEYDRLSDREKQVFLLMVSGNTTAKIADILSISPKTVEKHRASVSEKLGYANQTEMIKFAIRAGLLDPDFWKT